MTNIALPPQSHAEAIEAIHEGTALYTCPPEIGKLLDRINWPACGGHLLDPGCGDGNMIVEALTRLAPQNDDEASRVRGIEFHAPSAEEARLRCIKVLIGLGWNEKSANEAGRAMIETRDFLLDTPADKWDIILGNPPYWRRFRLPASYLAEYDTNVPAFARGDILHAYLAKSLDCLAPNGKMALVTTDRWLTNKGASNLRAFLGDTLRIEHAERLEGTSVFHRPKLREKNTPPRVHAVSIVLSANGEALSSEPFMIETLPKIEGVSLSDLVDIRLAPWLGPDGIFTVDKPDMFPNEALVPCILPKDIDPETDLLRNTTRWAIVTGDDKPSPRIMQHILANQERMPQRGLRNKAWQPPERFDKHLPLTQSAVLVPRISKRLRPIVIPAGHLPVNHSLVIASGLPAEDIRKMLEHPLVQKQADILASRIESGYRSYTATLLRSLVIPYEAIPEQLREAA